MAQPVPDDANKYVIDILNLNRRLAAATRHDNLQRITSALTQGQDLYFDLVFRRLFLDFRPKHTAVVLWLLDLIQARLADLERLKDQKSLNGVDAATKNHRNPTRRHEAQRVRRTS